MSRLNVANFRHPDATADSVVITSGGDTQIQRALGLGGATYGTSGQVLTSAGSGSVPTWEDLPAGVTFLTGQSVNTESSVIFTGIPTTANLIFIGISEVSQSATASGHMQVRFGNGSIVSSTGPYRFAVSYGSNLYNIDNGDQWSLIHNAFSGSGSIHNGIVIMTRIASANVWAGSWTISDRGGNNYTNVGGGYYSGSSGLIDRVQIRSQSSTYDSGNIVVGYA